MKRRETARGVCSTVALVAALALAACGSSSQKTVTVTGRTATAPPESTSTSQSTTTDPTTSSTSQSPATSLPLGAGTSVTGTTGETLSVAATKVTPLPASSFGQFAAPPQPAYGVFLTIDNTGSVAFSDDLENDVSLLSASGQTGSSSLSNPTSGPCAQNVNVSSLNLSPGQTVHVCVVVLKPAGAKPASVRFTPDGGLSSDYAEWQLR